VKFLLDVCASSRALTSFLIGHGHDVLSAYDINASASDEKILELAINDDRILVTEDKDFGEIAFAFHRRHGPIVRFVELAIDEQVQAMDELLSM
jgi:predicted nuclease of predicted toxin-antitoxin system